MISSVLESITSAKSSRFSFVSFLTCVSTIKTTPIVEAAPPVKVPSVLAVSTIVVKPLTAVVSCETFTVASASSSYIFLKASDEFAEVPALTLA